MSKFESAIQLLINNNITHTIKYNVGKSYEIDIFFDELSYTPTVRKVYDYTTGRLIN